MKLDATTKFLLQKLLLAFISGFVVALGTALSNVGNEPLTKSLLIGLLGGALGAGVRALLAASPLNIVPSDAQHTLIGGKKEGQ